MDEVKEYISKYTKELSEIIENSMKVLRKANHVINASLLERIGKLVPGYVNSISHPPVSGREEYWGALQYDLSGAPVYILFPWENQGSTRTAGPKKVHIPSVREMIKTLAQKIESY